MRDDNGAGAAGATAARTGVTVGFVGAGGGVGTTTVLLSVAFVLSSLERPVLSVELEGMVGSFAAQLRLTPRRSVQDVLARPAAIAEELDRCVIRAPCGLEVLCAPRVPAAAAPNGEGLDRLLHAAARRSALVFVDLPRGLPSVHERVVRHLDHVLVVLEPGGTSATDARRLVQRLRAWGVGAARVSGVVVEREVPSSREVALLQSACGEVGVRIAGIVPSAADACEAAARQGIPLTASSPEDPASLALVDLSRELVAEVESLRLYAAIVSRSDQAVDRLRELLDDADPVRFDVTRVADVDELLTDLVGGGYDVVLLVQDGPGDDPRPTLRRIAGLADRTAVVVLTAGQETGAVHPCLGEGAQEQLEFERVDAYWLCHAIRSSIERRRVGARLERERKDLIACETDLRRMVVQLLRENHADPRMV